MSSPEKPNQQVEYDEFKDLCYHIGLALLVWQDVEREHFLLFTSLLGTGHSKAASAAYYSTESFEARRKMLGNIAHFALTTKKQRTAWSDDTGGIQGQLKAANDSRNKLAHYRMVRPFIRAVEHQDGSVTVEFEGPRLRPEPFDVVSHLRGFTPDKEGHSLSVTEVNNMILQFQKVTTALFDFRMSLPAKPPSEDPSPVDLPPQG